MNFEGEKELDKITFHSKKSFTSLLFFFFSDLPYRF